MVTLVLTTLFTYIYERYFMTSFITSVVHARDLESVLHLSLPLYVNGLATLLFGKAYEVRPFNVLYLLFLIMLIYYTIYNGIRKYNDMLVYLTVSFLVIFVGYVFTDLSVDFLTTRFLMFSAISIYLIGSLMYRKGNTIYIALIFFILFMGAISNYMFISNLDYQPNIGELDLIGFLNDNNLKYGYADYWDSNIITYFSKEDIIVLPVTINHHLLMPVRWLSCGKWFTDRTTQNSTESYFILLKSNVTLTKEGLNSFAENSQLEKILQFGDYSIYVFNGLAPLTSSIDSITFQTNDGQYLFVDYQRGGEVFASHKKIGILAAFNLVEMGNNSVALQAHNGQYVCAENSSVRELVANRNIIDTWETFQLEDLGDNRFALRAWSGRYVSVEDDGAVVANSTLIGLDEAFVLTHLQE
ncbi:MAG: hypothetical protein PHQ34_01030 [Methanothrix sp.]|nr:hypothetical protein [Methanothrix sp.]